MSQTPTSTPAAATRTAHPIVNTRNGAVLALAAGIGFAAWALLAPGGSTDTEDAYVDGNVVQVTPQAGGSVTAISAHAAMPAPATSARKAPLRVLTIGCGVRAVAGVGVGVGVMIFTWK